MSAFCAPGTTGLRGDVLVVLVCNSGLRDDSLGASRRHGVGNRWWDLITAAGCDFCDGDALSLEGFGEGAVCVCLQSDDRVNCDGLNERVAQLRSQFHLTTKVAH